MCIYIDRRRQTKYGRMSSACYLTTPALKNSQCQTLFFRADKHIQFGQSRKVIKGTNKRNVKC